jgi:O-methyltransferase
MKKTTFLRYLGYKVNKILNLFGYGAIFYFKETGNPAYEIITTHPIYAPWNVDEDFKKIHKMVENNTLLDKYRSYEIWQLINEVKNIPGALIEVGTWRGGSGALISKRARMLGINDTIYLCDTFEGVVKVDRDKDSFYHSGAHSDASIKRVEKLVFDKMKLKNVKILKGIFPEETKHLIKDKKFRFCHIDVDIYHSAKDIFSWIWDKISVGGVIIYDDYGAEECDGMTKMVNEERGKPGRLIVYNLNGQAIEIKLP